MDMICYTCGDRGYTHALVVCDKCQGFAVHRYCMNVIVLTGDIKWSCEYCEANINPVKKCEKVFKDAEIKDLNMKRKRDGENEFSHNDENAVLQGREENGSSTTTSLDSDSQDWSKQGLEKNPGVQVNRKRRKEDGHHLDSNIEHVTVVERELLEKNDETKVSCDKKSDLTEKEAFVVEAVCGEIQGDNFEVDRVVQNDQHALTRNSSILSCSVERECMGNEDTFSEVQVGRPDRNGTPGTSESATIAASLPESDSDPRSTSKNSQIQGIDDQCIVSRRSTGHVHLVDKPSDVQNTLDLVSHKVNQSTTPEFCPVNENDNGASRYSQLDRTISAVSADTVSESDRNKPSKINKNATAGDTQIYGMNQRISLTQPTPPENVKSVHKHRSAQTSVQPRINRANGSPQSEPMHKVPRSKEQENHGLRSRKISNGPVADATDGVHRPRDACNVARGFRRRWDVRPKNVDQIPEFHDRSNGGLRGNSTDLVCGRSFGPEIHNFGYVPVQSLFDFVWNGWFKIDGTHSVRMGGHTSTSSPVKYKAASKSLPQVISLEKVDPGRVDITALTGRHVDIFFFPLDSRAENMVDQIIHEMINGNHLLKFKIDDTDLHIFSSFIFHGSSQRFQGRCYLWGRFSPASLPGYSRPSQKAQ